jgi:hypothetical protein
MLRSDPNNPICGPPGTPFRRVPARRLPLPPPTPCTRFLAAAAIAGAVGLGPAARADWVAFVEETSARLGAAPDVGAADPDEKSYSWGDIDRDGDVDLVVGRKQPFSTPGKRRNVLLMNESGVLVDRTATYAGTSDVAGDVGFLTPTNDRDILLVDVDQDGWLDVVTATAHGGSDPKHVGHPRVYRNLGADEDLWLGLRHEDARIPALSSYTGEPGFQPNFAAVAAGDVNADGYPDLYFSDYDPPGGEPSGSDFNDKLLLNEGEDHPGFFFDATAAWFQGVIDVPGGPDRPFPVSTFSASAAIVDMNGDGAKDILKQTALTSPLYVGIAYGDPAGGPFDTYDVIASQSPYYVSAGDLNRDDRMDAVITDDGNDRYLLNQGNGSDGLANFLSFQFSFFHDGAGGPAGDQGFGGDSRIADLDNDGWNDVLVTDVTVELPGCSRRMAIYRNLGGTSGANVALQEQTSGEQCMTAMGNPPSCIVAGIPASQLEGVHDVAVFDIDGNGFRDLVVGRCQGTAVYMNVPPVAAGAVPDGDRITGTPLVVERMPVGRVKLSWEASCSSGATDYAVYEGTIGDFTTHAFRTCTTGGATTLTFSAGPAAYFLVVPRSADREGSYGHDSAGNPRPPAAVPCLQQLVGACD